MATKAAAAARGAAAAGAAADEQRLDTAAQAAAKVLSEGGRLTLLKKTAKVLRASSGLTERLAPAGLVDRRAARLRGARTPPGRTTSP